VKALAALRPTILDRYVVREMVPPTAVGLLLFTFILLLDTISNLMRILVSRGADFGTVARAFLYLLPSIFSVTIPMAFLLGVLLAFGRLASDSELVALRASGVSPARLLRPVLALSVAAALATFYVVGIALPAANQAYRELIFKLVISKARTEMTARVFNDDLVPGMVFFISDIPARSGEWKDVFIHDARTPAKPRVILARTGRLRIDEQRKTVGLDLTEATVYSFNTIDPADFHIERMGTGFQPLPYEQFFPNIALAKGDREMSLGELSEAVRNLKAQGKGGVDWGRYAVEYHKKFAIPTACLVFGLLGLGLSLGSKKEARSAAFGLSIMVIFVYYVLIRLGEQAGDTGLLSPFLSMWGANIVLGAAALLLLFLNHREAAFDPLSTSYYSALLPKLSRRRGPPPRPALRRVGRDVRSGARPVVVLRIPRMRLPLPGILDSYVARSWSGHFLLVLAAFWSLFVLVNFMDLFDEVQTNKIKGIIVVRYYAFFSPGILHLLTPVGVLVAVLITYGVMSRRNEITALKAGGISIYRAAVPVLVIGAAVCLAMFGASEYVLPPMSREAKRYENIIRGRPVQASSLESHRWILGSDGRLYNYDYLGPEGARQRDRITLYGLSVYDVEPRRWQLREVLYVASAAWNGMGYDVERGWRRAFGDRPSFHEVARARTREIEPPSYFGTEARAADTLRFRELQAHIASLEALGVDVIPLRVQLHHKLAYPFVCVVMTLLGIPFSFVVARRGALYGIGASILLAIVYWACLTVSETLGNTARLPPALAAWGPNLIFGALALYLVLNLET
jgi:LPS export ABC transporter permease LptF/LPS export ABC transporter permease LptG